MKKYITNVILFLTPIIFLQGITMFFYSTDKGDLMRLGYILDFSDYRHIFKDEFKRNIFFDKISEINLNTQNNYTVLTVGDSFSEQGNHGYKNYLSENDSIKLIHFDRFLHDNPIQTLYGILNGDLLNNLKVDYIILQSIERNFVRRVDKIDRKNVLLKEFLIKEIDNEMAIKKMETTSIKLIKEKLFNLELFYKILYNNILYFFDDNAYGSQTYKVETKQNLFSINKNELLFYFGDLENLEANNDIESVLNLNNELNNLAIKLKEKGIKLIVLPSPDKFDFYYDDIVDKTGYPRPLFFEHMEKMQKDYIYVKSKQILRGQMYNKKDIYFYDDTHWSPWASKVIANELVKIIVKE